jgi:hypothetical protein
MASLKFGKSIHNSSYKQVPRSAITDIEGVMSTMTIAKPKKGKKKEEAAPAEPTSPDDKKKKKKKEKPSDLPDAPPMLVGPDMTPAQALRMADGWRSSVVISRKSAVGALATSSFK